MRLFWRFVKPVAVDGHRDEEQHRHNDRRDDYSQRDDDFTLVVDGTHNPLAVTELHLKTHRDRLFQVHQLFSVVTKQTLRWTLAPTVSLGNVSHAE